MKRTHDNYRIDYNENIRINKQICSAKNARELIDIYDHNKLNFNYINISTIIHRFAKMKGDKNFIIGLIPLITDNLRNFDSQHLANLVWAFAKLNIKNEELFDLLTKEVSYKIKDFDPQETANLAWSFAKLDIKNKELFELLAKEASCKIKDFKPQEIANLAWSFATLDIKNIELFETLAIETSYKIKDFNPQEIVNLAWSFATSNTKNIELFDLLAKETSYKIKSFKSQDIANLSWSFANLNITNVELFEVLVKETFHKIKKFKSQDLTNLVWAFATLNIKNIELFDLLAQETSHKIKDFKSQEIANLAWSFATLNIKNIELFDLLAKETFYKIKDFNSQNLTNLLWSFAVLDIKSIELFELLISSGSKDYNSSGKFQMYQVYLHCKYELKSDRLINLLEEIDFSTIRENIIRSSNFHLDCVLHLQLLGLEHQNEININGLYCDVYLPDKNIIIEINGPSHYTHLNNEPLGRTVFKSRLLKAMGYIVKTIPYWDWDDMDNSEEKKTYLLNLLKYYMH